jgi:hypothetical protein
MLHLVIALVALIAVVIVLGLIVSVVMIIVLAPFAALEIWLKWLMLPRAERERRQAIRMQEKAKRKADLARSNARLQQHWLMSRPDLAGLAPDQQDVLFKRWRRSL